MAQVVKLVDDIDQNEDGVTTVRFSYDGTDWEIDLGKQNKDAMDGDMGKWTAHARRIGATSGRLARGHGASGGTQRTRARRDRAQTGHIREWARENGWPNISKRGRIPAAAEVAYETYEEAHR